MIIEHHQLTSATGDQFVDLALIDLFGGPGALGPAPQPTVATTPIRRDAANDEPPGHGAVEFDPQYAVAYNRLGCAAVSRGDFRQAVEYFDLAVRSNPMLASAFNNRGYALAGLKQYDRAIADFDMAVRIDPQFAAAFNNRGLAFAAKRDFDRAIADASEAIRLNSTIALAYQNRGMALAAKGLYDEAVRDFDEAIRLAPKTTNAYHNRGFCFTARGATLRERWRTSASRCVAVPISRTPTTIAATSTARRANTSRR